MSFLARVASRKAATAVRASRSTVARSSALFHTTAPKQAEEGAAAGAEATAITLNFTTPTGTMYEAHECDQVIIPGVVGSFGVTAGHTPNVSEMKPGVIEIFHEEGDKESEKFFVAGGFSFLHPNSVCDITAIEACRVEDLDVDAATAAAAQYKTQMDSAPAESIERSEAEIAYDTAAAMCEAAGRPLA